MYLGMVVVTLGVAICLGSVSPFLLPGTLFLVLDRRFVRREEQFLRDSLGTAYDDYSTRVRRWI
jgi:protein-S-isoprenylcysteine O-methyltransferase Ste14